MDITLVIPTIKRYDRLRKALDTYFAGTRLPNRVLIIDNGKKPSPLTYIVPPDERADRNIWVIETPVNLGVAGSVNLAIRVCMSFNTMWLHSNDDVEVEVDMLKKLEDYLAEIPIWDPQVNGKIPFVVPEFGAGSLFTIFLCDPFFMAQMVGFFDETFFPAYFEDNDYARRMVLQGLQYRNLVVGAVYTHHYSSTLQAYSPEEHELHDKQFKKNEDYYIKKWGGKPEFETFTVPFNGEEQK